MVAQERPAYDALSKGGRIPIHLSVVLAQGKGLIFLIVYILAKAEENGQISGLMIDILPFQVRQAHSLPLQAGLDQAH